MFYVSVSQTFLITEHFFNIVSSLFTEHLFSLVIIYQIKVSATVSITRHMKDFYKNSYMNSVFNHVKKAKSMFNKEL